MKGNGELCMTCFAPLKANSIYRSIMSSVIACGLFRGAVETCQFNHKGLGVAHCAGAPVVPVCPVDPLLVPP